jgi:hypothetical protein
LIIFLTAVLYTCQHILERSDGKRVILIPMVHVGEQTFFTEVMETICNTHTTESNLQNAVVLLEGVAPSNAALTSSSKKGCQVILICLGSHFLIY